MFSSYNETMLAQLPFHDPWSVSDNGLALSDDAFMPFDTPEPVLSPRHQEPSNPLESEPYFEMDLETPVFDFSDNTPMFYHVKEEPAPQSQPMNLLPSYAAQQFVSNVWSQPPPPPEVRQPSFASYFPQMEASSLAVGHCPAPSFIPETLPNRQLYHSMPVRLEETVVFSHLNTYDFDFCYPQAAPSFRTTPRLQFDISSTFSAAKYSEIFNQYGAQLLLEKHPQLNEEDFKHIEKRGFMYFIKNVKTIVPTIGPWKFLSHVRTGNGSSDRSYNLVGFPIRCKVKEWVVGSDLWRVYHFVKGKTPKQRAH